MVGPPERGLDRARPLEGGWTELDLPEREINRARPPAREGGCMVGPSPQ